LVRCSRVSWFQSFTVLGKKEWRYGSVRADSEMKVVSSSVVCKNIFCFRTYIFGLLTQHKLFRHGVVRMCQ